MNIDRELVRLDNHVHALREELDALYEAGAPEEKKERAWAKLEKAIEAREWHLWAYEASLGWMPLEKAWRQIYAALMDLAEKFSELAQQHIASFSRMLDTAGLTTDVIKRLMKEGEASRRPGPRQVFAPAAIGIGPIGLCEFRRAMPTNRKPMYPGYMRQKGRG